MFKELSNFIVITVYIYICITLYSTHFTTDKIYYSMNYYTFIKCLIIIDAQIYAF